MTKEVISPAWTSLSAPNETAEPIVSMIEKRTCLKERPGRLAEVA